MQLRRNEVMTGVLVIGTIAVLAFLLVLLGAPGLFRPLVTYRVYFDNAAGIKPGATVMLAGRKIGQVQRLYSPVPPDEEKQAQQAAAAVHPAAPGASPGPTAAAPRFEARVDVLVDKNARVYRDARAVLMQLGLLGDMAIDFTQGTRESGRAKD
ncbi:MAG: MCE family protein, partial [Chthoniobacterales bacterium]|nr:MCE family protein [Chthoniobacterales bacterium]